MSNVLIGIIGVILFIGLALAGALILGDDFATTSNSSQAAAIVSQLQQTQAAAEMWRLKTGQRTIVTQDTAFLVPRFLKTPGANASSWGRNHVVPYWRSVYFNNDIDANQDDEGRIYAAGWAMVVIGLATDARARSICQAIEEGQGRSTVIAQRFPTSPIGCALSNGNSTGEYVAAYATIGF